MNTPTTPPTSQMQELGRLVRKARRELAATFGREPSQGKIAKALGWSQQKYSNLERGKQERISVEDLHQLAVQLQVDEYWLFTGRHPQPVGDLAMQIDRLELDQWGETSVLAVAQSAAKRVADQEAARPQADDFIQAVERMMAAGLDRETAEQAARSLTQPQA